MSVRSLVLALAGLWLLATAAHADDSEPSTPPAVAGSAAPAPAVTPPRGAFTESPWRLGLGLGYGQRTNPLIQSEDIPVIVDLDFAWFGKRWFFDNGDLGFTLRDSPLATTSIVARVNSDRVFFAKTNTRYVNFAYLGDGETGELPPGNLVDEPVAVDPPDRDYAVELGIESLLEGDWGAAALRAFHDVSGTHGGFEISADYQYRVTRGRFSFAPSIGVAYKSQQLNDYYWGVHEDEASSALPVYHADDGFGWEAGIKASYYLTKSLRLAVSVDYERLQDTVAASPLAAEDHVLGYFSGLAWTF